MAGTLGVTELTQQKKTLFAQTNYGPVLLKKNLTGGPYPRGQVLGVITASGKYTAYGNGAVNGAEVAKAVLAEDADGSLADVEAMVCAVGVLVEVNLTGLDAAAKADLEAAQFFFV